MSWLHSAKQSLLWHILGVMSWGMSPELGEFYSCDCRIHPPSKRPISSIMVLTWAY